MGVRVRCRLVFLLISTFSTASVRAIGRLLGISKSSVHRHKKAIEARNTHLESSLLETAEGQQWLFRLLFATLFVFGIMSGVGAGKIFFFLSLLRIEKHIGISASSLRNLIRVLEEKILEYKKIHEATDITANNREIVAGCDETFFESIILVLMDLSSGYILMEDESDNRTYDTWNDKVKGVVSRLGISITYMVSDRAKALIKLALDGMNCPSIPDLFHASNELVKLFGLALNRKLASVQEKVSKAIVVLAFMNKMNKDISIIQGQQNILDALHKEEAMLVSGIDRYRSVIHMLSTLVHPFSISNGNIQTSSSVHNGLMGLVDMVKALRDEYGINDNHDGIIKFSNQIADIASLIDAWWLWVNRELVNCSEKEWLIEALLPTLYWQNQADRTKNSELKKEYHAAFERARSAFEHHSHTQLIRTEELQEWESWCEWMISKFQRASSAVEGRNGFLSQMHHNGRGISGRRLGVLTVIHNFVIKRPDGTTAAQRLFGADFPDLFEWLLTQMREPPLPRQRRCASRVSI